MSSKDKVFYSPDGNEENNLKFGLSAGNNKDFKKDETAFEFLQKLLPSGKIILMEQVHGDKIRKIQPGDLKNQKIYCPGVDGVYLDLPKTRAGISLGVRIADCMAVFMVKGKTLRGAFHAGWRGVAKNIGTRFSKLFSRNSRKDLKFLVSPHICGNCFEVSKDILKHFPENATYYPVYDKDTGQILKNKGRVDLYEGLKYQLAETGVKKENINLLKNKNYCTFENKFFYSHRRKNKKRMLAFAIQH
ncbi:MAG: polyphenol oxidase family protein [Elusimicrobiota bacterium]